jgi:hypothetical protein
MIRYVPPTDPEAYRVVRLDLSDGDLYPVLGRDKSPVDTMTGTRLLQVASPNGTMLFTLYTEQPPAYAAGYDKTEAAAGQPVAFVHTLNLDQGFAICVSLPKALWGGNPLNEALAVSPDSRWLYVVDMARGVVTTLDADALKVARRVEVDFGPGSPDQARATVSPDGRALVVARGEQLVVLDTATLQPDRIWMMRDTVSGLGFSADGLRLYVAMPDRVAVVDPSNGREARTIAAPGVDGIRFVETLSA